MAVNAHRSLGENNMITAFMCSPATVFYQDIIIIELDYKE